MSRYLPLVVILVVVISGMVFFGIDHLNAVHKLSPPNHVYLLSDDGKVLFHYTVENGSWPASHCTFHPIENGGKSVQWNGKMLVSEGKPVELFALSKASKPAEAQDK